MSIADDAKTDLSLGTDTLQGIFEHSGTHLLFLAQVDEVLTNCLF